MATIALTGSDTVLINGRLLADLADGDVSALTFPNDISTVKTGKNGNSLYGLDESGRQAELILRVIRGSADDKFLNNLLAQQRNSFSGFVLMIARFIKKVGDGLGNQTSDTYDCSGGIFFKNIEAKTNVEGDTEQSVAMYSIRFANSVRVIT